MTATFHPPHTNMRGFNRSVLVFTLWSLVCSAPAASCACGATDYCQFGINTAYPHKGLCHGTATACSCDTDWDPNACADKPLPTDPTYDHQKRAYEATHRPTTFDPPSDDLTIMPYFSPETSSSTMVDLIDSATESLHVGTPGFSSWSGCTPYDNSNKSCVKACSPAAQRAEKFPIFPALLNALHRGVKLTVLTNDYGTDDCPGTISPLPFLALNGAQVRYFTTVTFLHTKFIVVDKKKVAPSTYRENPKP